MTAGWQQRLCNGWSERKREGVYSEGTSYWVWSWRFLLLQLSPAGTLLYVGCTILSGKELGPTLLKSVSRGSIIRIVFNYYLISLEDSWTNYKINFTCLKYWSQKKKKEKSKLAGQWKRHTADTWLFKQREAKALWQKSVRFLSWGTEQQNNPDLAYFIYWNANLPLISRSPRLEC